MAKASERKGVRTEEYECCAATRRKLLETIRQTYVNFPVIRKIPCPTCKKVLMITVYERPGVEPRVVPA